MKRTWIAVILALLLGLGGGIAIGPLSPPSKVETITSIATIEEGTLVPITIREEITKVLRDTVTFTIAETLISTITEIYREPTVITKTDIQRNTITVTAMQTVTRTFKPLGPYSIIMLIGDLDEKGPNPYIEAGLRRRIDIAARAGVDTIIMIFKTTSIEVTFDHLDKLIEYAAVKGIGVIPRIIVDSTGFTERVRGNPGQTDWDLPDYTNATQLAYGLEILRRVILHLEKFPNIVGYQVEWGHWGESWVNAAFWNSRSSNESFKSFLSKVAPGLLPVEDFAWWWNSSSPVHGDIIYYSPYLPSTDPRRDPAKVAVFYWYQEWRNRITLNITWSFRCLARELTTKPIIGFSYVVVPDVSYVYSADKCLDAAFSPFPPGIESRPNRFYIRDAYFTRLQLAELDFDTPYVSMEHIEDVIRDSYRKGIIPVIFYPLWSSKLRDLDIPKIVEYMRKYAAEYGYYRKGQILVVVGNLDVGYHGYSTAPAAAYMNWYSKEPPGFLRFLEEKGITYDLINARVYTPELGDRYKAVVVFAPRDTVDGELLYRLLRTRSPVYIMFPSFIVGTPSENRPYELSSAIFGLWNYIEVRGRLIGIQVTGSPPTYSINFTGNLSSLGSINDYQANHLFAYFKGSFDEVLAVVTIGGEVFTTIGRIDNLYLVGLDIHITNERNRQIIFNALSILLANAFSP